MQVKKLIEAYWISTGVPVKVEEDFDRTLFTLENPLDESKVDGKPKRSRKAKDGA